MEFGIGSLGGVGARHGGLKGGLKGGFGRGEDLLELLHEDLGVHLRELLQHLCAHTTHSMSAPHPNSVPDIA
eukprot:730662-Rhodomonas_salina.2